MLHGNALVCLQETGYKECIVLADFLLAHELYCDNDGAYNEQIPLHRNWVPRIQRDCSRQAVARDESSLSLYEPVQRPIGYKIHIERCVATWTTMQKARKTIVFVILRS